MDQQRQWKVADRQAALGTAASAAHADQHNANRAPVEDHKEGTTGGDQLWHSNRRCSNAPAPGTTPSRTVPVVARKAVTADSGPKARLESTELLMQHGSTTYLEVPDDRTAMLLLSFATIADHRPFRHPM